jgi:thioredoxin reductase (NADPH)
MADTDDGFPHFPELPDLEARRHQIFFTLTEAEISRLERVGERRTFQDGEVMFEEGKVTPGMLVILSGQVGVSRHDVLGRVLDMGTRGPGHFLAEMGQLLGARAPMTGRASGRVEALLVPTEALRNVLVTDVELGGRLLRAFILRRKALAARGVMGPILVAPPSHPRLHRLQEFLLRSGHPHRALDPDTDADAATLIARHEARPEDLPLVVCPDGSVLRNPGDIALGRYLDVLPNSVRDRGYDVAVVGAGPAGLSTAVYAASEGLSVLVVDARGFGGQAGASARIENYFGFPMGLSGQELTGRGFTQATKFGTEFAMPVQVTRLSGLATDGAGSPLSIELDDGRKVSARTVVVASGARYRRPSVPGLEELEGRGVSYWASPIEAASCRGQDVVLVGGGNSAGQGAVFLSNHAARVLVLIRGPGLADSMSRYLIDRIAATPNIHLHPHTELAALERGDDGEMCLARWRNRKTGAEHSGRVGHVFIFVGADPATEWLRDCPVALDDKGFVKTGSTLTLDELVRTGRRTVPASLETNVAGVFAVGDVRSGSVKRVGGAIGEGAAVVPQLHAYLAELARKTAGQSPTA